MQTTYFDRFTIALALEDALNCSHPGACDNDVAEVLTLDYVRNQFKHINDHDLSTELRDYGAWDAEELSDRAANEARIIWIAAGNIRDEQND